MAAAAGATFRSATRRDGPEDAGSATRGREAADGGSGGLRRSRSLSRFPPPSPSPDDVATPSSRFVNKVRGGGGRRDGGGLGLPQVSLDDLADEFFRARAESEDDEEGVVPRGEDARGRPRFPAPTERGGGRRGSTARYARDTESSKLRGRSVSRPPVERVGGTSNAASVSAAARRQRYASVDMRASMDRHRWCDSDNDMDVSHRYSSRGINTKFSTGNSVQTSFQKSAKANQSLRRSTSQKDFLHSRDSSSSHSSLTDDESRDTRSFCTRNQKGTQSVYTHEKDHLIGNKDGNVLYDVMRKEVRQAVEEIKTQLEKAVTKSESSGKICTAVQPTQVFTELRRSYTSILEESEKRKQELLAQLAAEEQRGHELTKMVRELLPNNKNVNSGRQPRQRRRSNDRARMSKRLIEEAEQYFEDFLSNVEDTDFSSFDGEKSDASSTKRDVLLHGMVETPVALQNVAAPVESDGVVLPWLQWETSNDLQTSPCKTKIQGASTACSTSNHTMSSRGSWSPGGHGSSAASKDKLFTSFDEVGIRQSSCDTRSSSFHMDDYLHLRRSEDLFFERWRQKQRIDDGGLILCSRSTIM